MKRLPTGTPRVDRARWANHAPGHVRDMFLDAIAAFADWNDDDPEPKVSYEVNFEPHEIEISKACGLLWNCKDILPGHHYQWLRDCGIEPQRQTYAAAAHAILDRIKMIRMV
jgi:hypothetical protein